MSLVGRNNLSGVAILRIAVEIGLVLILAYICSQILWLFAAPGGRADGDLAQSSIGRTAIPQQSAGPADDYSILISSNPFSTRDQSQSIIDKAAQDAPETSLNLKLKGVRANGDGQGVAFILLPDNSQLRATVGLEILDGVEVEYVFEDRITLRTRGKLETLYLRDSVGERTRLITSPASEGPSRRAALGEGISVVKFLSSVELSIVREEGQRAGYQLASPIDNGVMQAAGFQKGDIIRAVDGFSVAEIDSEDLTELLLQSSNVEFDVERAGQTVRVLVQFAQGAP